MEQATRSIEQEQNKSRYQEGHLVLVKLTEPTKIVRNGLLVPFRKEPRNG